MQSATENKRKPTAQQGSRKQLIVTDCTISLQPKTVPEAKKAIGNCL